ncbi:MAG: hypothetical protein ABJA34_02660 [Pseudonocardiales bacterium]
MPDDVELAEAVYAVSDEAFALAQAVAVGGEADAQRAGQLAERAAELGPAARDSLDGSLRQILSETQVDLNYALNGGRAPMSLRLGQILRDQR